MSMTGLVVAFRTICGWILVTVALCAGGCGRPIADEILDGRSAWSEAERVRPLLEFFDAQYTAALDLCTSRSQLVSAKKAMEYQLPKPPDVCAYVIGMGATSLEEAVALRGVSLFFDAISKAWEAGFSEAEIAAIHRYQSEWSTDLPIERTFVWLHRDDRSEIVSVPRGPEWQQQSDLAKAERLRRFRESEAAREYLALEPRLNRAVLDSLDVCLGSGDKGLGRRLRLDVLDKRFGIRLQKYKESR